jgi:hypothetical protein
MRTVEKKATETGRTREREREDPFGTYGRAYYAPGARGARFRRRVRPVGVDVGTRRSESARSEPSGTRILPPRRLLTLLVPSQDLDPCTVRQFMLRPPRSCRARHPKPFDSLSSESASEHNYEGRCLRPPGEIKTIRLSLISTIMSGASANFPIDLKQYKKLRESHFSGDALAYHHT